MAGLNQITLIGNIGKDAESRQVGDSNVIIFNVAVSRKYKDKQGQEQTDTQWFSVEYWSKSVALLQYLTKGKQMMIQGEMRSRTYEDKDKQERTIWFVRASELMLLGGGGQHEQKPDNTEKAKEAIKALNDKFGTKIPTDGDLPF